MKRDMEVVRAILDVIEDSEKSLYSMELYTNVHNKLLDKNLDNQITEQHLKICLDKGPQLLKIKRQRMQLKRPI